MTWTTQALEAAAARLFPAKGKHHAAEAEGCCMSCEQANNGLARGRHCGRCWCC